MIGYGLTTRLVAGMLAGLVTAGPLLASTAAAGVEARFVAPERFADRDFRRSPKGARAVTTLEAFLVDLGRRYLPGDQQLTIEVLDASLAGDYGSFWSSMHDVRVLTATTPPRFKVRYTLKSGSRVTAQAQESITDIDYLTNPATRASSDPLVYEKALLERWFRQRFAG